MTSLRTVLIGVVAALLIAGVIAWLRHGPGLIPPVLLLSLVLVALLFENIRYRQAAAQAPGGAFKPTGERFIDPETGKLIEVHSDPATGARRYIAVGHAKDTP